MGIPAWLFYATMRISPPRIRSRMWKSLYQRMAKSQTDESFRFMNYGFDGELTLDLEQGDESDRFFIQLYFMNIQDIEVEGKRVLEVGSGRGGGASWIARSLKPLSLTALDYSGEAISLCKKWYSEQDNLFFVEGSAEDIPFASDSFDVVYNVESSHCYANIPSFLSEAFRVLKKGGYFCWTDIRDKARMEKMESQFLEVGFKIVSSKEVTGNVMSALEHIHKDRSEMIRQRAPPSLRKSFETFGGVPGTPIFESFKSGRLNYFRYLLTRE